MNSGSPFFPIRPFRAVTALCVLLIMIILTAGCGGWDGGYYTPDQDVRITKLDSNGVMEWTYLIETGTYDYAKDFAATPDGGVVVIGGTSKLGCMKFPPSFPETPQLIRFSATGEKLWTQDYSISQVIPNRDGSLSAISGDTKIRQLDTNGSVIHEYDPGFSRNSTGTLYYNHSFVGLADGKYLFPGSMIVNVNNSESLSWVRINVSNIDRIYSLIAAPDTKGYLILVMDTNGSEILTLDSEGNLIKSYPIDNFSETITPKLHRTSEGYSVIIDKFGEFWEYQFDKNGTILRNISIATRDAVILADDGGFITIARPEPHNRVTKTTFDLNGTIVSQVTTLCSADRCPHISGNIIRTTDGGYALMERIQKQMDC